MSKRLNVVEQGRRHLAEKLQFIEEQRVSITDSIDGIVQEVSTSARHLLAEQDNKQFLLHYMSVMQNLEKTANMLFLICASLPDNMSEDNISADFTLPSTSSTVYNESFNQQSLDNTRRDHDIIPSPSVTSFRSCPDALRLVPDDPVTQGVSLATAQKLDTTKVSGSPDGDIANVQYLLNDSTQSAKGASVQVGDCSSMSVPAGKSQDLSRRSRLKPTSTNQAAVKQDVRLPTLTYESGKMLNVIVTEVVNPSMFWAQPVGPYLDDVMDEISHYYGKNGRYIRACDLHLGMECCALYTKDKTWYRARIVALQSESNTSHHQHTGRADVEVLYLDYGNCERLPLSSIRHLEPQFAELPSQTFCCALSEVAPPHSLKEWAPEHAIEFSRLVRDRPLQAVLMPQSDDCPVRFADLYFPTEKQDPSRSPCAADIMQNIGDHLIIHRQARKAQQKHVVQMLNSLLAIQSNVHDWTCMTFTEVIASVAPKIINQTSSNPKTTPSVQNQQDGAGFPVISRMVDNSSTIPKAKGIPESSVHGATSDICLVEKPVKTSSPNLPPRKAVSDHVIGSSVKQSTDTSFYTTWWKSGENQQKDVIPERSKDAKQTKAERISEQGGGSHVNTEGGLHVDGKELTGNKPLLALSDVKLAEEKVEQSFCDGKRKDKVEALCDQQQDINVVGKDTSNGEGAIVSGSIVSTSSGQNLTPSKKKQKKKKKKSLAVPEFIEACQSSSADNISKTDKHKPVAMAKSPSGETAVSDLKLKLESTDSLAGKKAEEDLTLVSEEKNVDAVHSSEDQSSQVGSNIVETWEDLLADETFDECLNEAILQSTLQASGRSLSEASDSRSKTPQQKLIELGFPPKLPKNYEKHKEFEKWLEDGAEKIADQSTSDQMCKSGAEQEVLEQVGRIDVKHTQQNVVEQSCQNDVKDPVVDTVHESDEQKCEAVVQEKCLSGAEQTKQEQVSHDSCVSVPNNEENCSNGALQPTGENSCSVADSKPTDKENISSGKREQPLQPESSPNSNTIPCGMEEVTDELTDCESFGLTQQDVPINDDGSIKVMMSHVESPADFYVHLVSPEAAQLDPLMEQLAKHYGNLNNFMLNKFLGGLSIGDICCAQFSDDNSFYRAEIVEKCSGEAISDGSEFKVFYMDYGNSEWLNSDKVLPLIPEFRKLPPFAYHCCLKDVYPTSGTSWSKQSVEGFEKLTGYNKPLLGYILQCKEGTPGKSQLQVILVDTTGEADVWVNRELVALGLARSKLADVGTKQESPKSPDVAPSLNDWDPMKEDFQSIRNSYQVDIDDPGVATVGYKANDERRICKFYNTREGCYRGELCPWEHSISPKGAVTTDKDLVFSATDSEHGVRLPTEGSWVVVDITAVLSPNHFFVNFPFGVHPLQEYKNQLNRDDGYSSDSFSSIESLEALFQDMNDHYSKMSIRNVDLTEFALGEIIVAKFSGDRSWHRARVIDTNGDEEKVEVFYVDYGNSEWVSERNTRRIEQRFMYMPFQAVECFLDDVEPPSADRKWAKESRKMFRDLTDGRTLFCRVVSRGVNRVIHVELYDTSGDDEIFINDELKKTGLAKSRQKSRSLCIQPDTVLYLPG